MLRFQNAKAAEYRLSSSKFANQTHVRSPFIQSTTSNNPSAAPITIAIPMKPLLRCFVALPTNDPSGLGPNSHRYPLDLFFPCVNVLVTEALTRTTASAVHNSKSCLLSCEHGKRRNAWQQCSGTLGTYSSIQTLITGVCSKSTSSMKQNFRKSSNLPTLVRKTFSKKSNSRK